MRLKPLTSLCGLNPIFNGHDQFQGSMTFTLYIATLYFLESLKFPLKFFLVLVNKNQSGN